MEELDKNNGYKQLCWKCAKACNLNACIWVATLKIKPLGVELDKQGYIIKCPLFEKDNGIYNKQDLANKLGVTPQEYKQICYVILQLIKAGIKTTIEECVKFMHETGGTCKDYASIKRGLKRGNLEYMPIVYVYNQLKKNNYEMHEFVKICNAEYKPTKQETKALEKFIQQEEIKAQKKKQEQERQKAEQEKFFTSYLGNNAVDMSKEICERIEAYIGIYKHMGVETNFEECIRFMRKTNLEFFRYFHIKSEMLEKSITESPEDYYFKNYIKEQI